MKCFNGANFPVAMYRARYASIARVETPKRRAKNDSIRRDDRPRLRAVARRVVPRSRAPAIRVGRVPIRHESPPMKPR